MRIFTVFSCALLGGTASAQPVSGLLRWQVSRDGLAWSSSITLNPGEPYKVRAAASWVDGAAASVGFAGCTFEQIDLIGADSSDIFGGAAGIGGAPSYVTLFQAAAEMWTIQAGTGASAAGLKLDQVNPVLRNNLGQLPLHLLRDGIPNPLFSSDNPITLLVLDAVAGVPKTLTLSATWTRLGSTPTNEFKIYTTVSGTNKKPVQEAVMSSAVVTIIPGPATLALLLLASAGRRARSRCRSILILTLAATVTMFAAPAARAQCDPLDPGPADRIAGFDSDVRAFTTWDPDGPGPRPALLIAAGDFDIAVDTEARNTAAWDGAAWHGLGEGVGFIVRSLTTYQGDLIAAGTGGVARWDGEHWTFLAPEVNVEELAVYRGDLYAVGYFAAIGGVPADGIARWDGSAWNPVGSGIPSTTTTSARSLLVFEDRLIVGGQFASAGGVPSNHTAAWDGSAWSAMPGLPATVPTSGGIWSLAIHQGSLYAGGNFALGSFRSIARWTGSTWAGFSFHPAGQVFALTSHDGRLFAGGDFSIPGAPPAEHIAAWDGAAWDTLDGGMNSLVVALYSHADTLYAGGLFTGTEDGSLRALHAATWDGADWHALADESTLFGTAESSEIRTLAEWRGSIYAGGNSMTLDDTSLDAGIAVFDGESSWSALTAVEGEINVLAEIDDRLIAGGDFSEIGGTTVAGIAAWDGLAWRDIGGGVTGTPVRVNAVTAFRGDLIAAGRFTGAGGAPAANIAAWNGAAWRPLGGGLNGEVYALAVYDGELIAGGEFNSAGASGQAAYRIAGWDGLAWRPLADGGLNNAVFALAVHEGRLFIGGRFTGSFDLSGLNYAVGWEGGDWIRLGPALLNPCSPPGYCSRSGIRAFTTFQGRLFACGQVSLPGERPGGSVIAWDGAQWTPIAIAPSAAASNMNLHTLAVLGPDLHVGGNFESLGGRAHFDWARLRSCPADLACDGIADFADYLEFLNLYEAQDPRVDFTADGVVDFADYLEFLNLYEAGC